MLHASFWIFSLTLNGQLGWRAFLGANHVLSDALVLSFVDSLHVVDQQISSVDDAQSVVKTATNVVQVNRNSILSMKKVIN